MMRDISESRHWTRTERVPGYEAATVVSRDVRWVLLSAHYRSERSSRVRNVWERLRDRITRLWRPKKKT
jgi:hypothetical protein